MQNTKRSSGHSTNLREVCATPQLVPLISPVVDTIARLPATRYYGSKRKLLGWIYSKLKSLEFDTALDLFGGTASVSQLLRAMRKTVTYNDAFRFNTDVATTLLAPDLPLTKEEVANFLAFVKPVEGVIARNFRGIFYLEEENAWIDGFMEMIRRGDRSKREISLLLYLLYQACLKKRPFNLFHRANLSLRTRRNISRSFGNFSTWERSFSYHIERAYDDLFKGRIIHAPTATILPPQDASAVDTGFDLVYIDPPYLSTKGTHSRDDYWRRYHFLEGLSTYASWEENLDGGSDIRLMPRPEYFAQWSNRASFKEALFDLIRLHSKSIVALSYVTSAYPSEQQLRQLFESEFNDVSVHTIEHAHILSKSRKREMLLVGLPK